MSAIFPLPGFSISIHAPRKGSDCFRSVHALPPPNFNPRPPQGERQLLQVRSKWRIIFQSTPPARGATDVWRCLRLHSPISIHAPRKGSDVNEYLLTALGSISIHAPRKGSDCPERSRSSRQFRISIHAPRKGSDHLAPCSQCGRKYFNPRPPQGERQSQVCGNKL